MTSVDIRYSYHLLAVSERIVRKKTFFRDRYFPTGRNDLFAAQKVLVDLRREHRRMAAVVSPRAKSITVERPGFETFEYEPLTVAVSRELTVDDLERRGFGEALYSNLSAEERSARLLLDDMGDMDGMIGRREEWMAAQTMMNNACPLQEYVDGQTKGETVDIKFYRPGEEKAHTFTVSKKWDEDGGDIKEDVKAMTRMLELRGVIPQDLLLGVDAADVITNSAQIHRELDNRRMLLGYIKPELTEYEGVAFLGQLDFNGYMVNVFSVAECYEDENGAIQRVFPADAAALTCPNIGRTAYGAVRQIDFGNSVHTTHLGMRIPKLTVDQDNDIRKLTMTAKPLVAPNVYCPVVYAEKVVTAA